MTILLPLGSIPLNAHWQPAAHITQNVLRGKPLCVIVINSSERRRQTRWRLICICSKCSMLLYRSVAKQGICHFIDADIHHRTWTIDTLLFLFFAVQFHYIMLFEDFPHLDFANCFYWNVLMHGQVKNFAMCKFGINLALKTVVCASNNC